MGRAFSSDSRDEDEDHLNGDAVVGGLLGAFIGAATGAAAGVSLYGARALPPGRRGSFAAALLASLTTLVATLYLAYSDNEVLADVGLTGCFFLPPAAASLVYGLSVPSTPRLAPGGHAPPPVAGRSIVLPVVQLAF